MPEVRFTTAPQLLKDAVIFYIDQSSLGFELDGNKSHQVKHGNHNLAAKLPYDNLFLQFKDIGVWLVDYNEHMYTTSFSKTTLDNYYEGIEIQPIDPPITIGYKNMVLTGYKVDTTGDWTYVDPKYADVSETSFLNTYVKIIINFTNIISCKNIRTAKIHGAPKRKKHKKPLHSYYILQLANQVKSAKGKVKNIWSNRVHLCMGHMKTYTAAKPLFGHYVGNVWCPPHARGNRALGVVHKDYAL